MHKGVKSTFDSCLRYSKNVEIEGDVHDFMRFCPKLGIGSKGMSENYKVPSYAAETGIGDIR